MRLSVLLNLRKLSKIHKLVGVFLYPTRKVENRLFPEKISNQKETFVSIQRYFYIASFLLTG